MSTVFPSVGAITWTGRSCWFSEHKRSRKDEAGSGRIAPCGGCRTLHAEALKNQNTATDKLMTRNAVIARQFPERRVETCVLESRFDSDTGLTPLELSPTNSGPKARIRLASTVSFVLPLQA